MLTFGFDVHKFASGLQVDLVGVESFLRIRVKFLQQGFIETMVSAISCWSCPTV